MSKPWRGADSWGGWQYSQQSQSWPKDQNKAKLPKGQDKPQAALQYSAASVNTTSSTGCNKLKAWAIAQGVEVPPEILGELMPPENPVKQIQAVVNKLRKATLKVNRLQAEAQTLGQKWEALQRDIQQQFIREKSRYVADLQKNREAAVTAKQEEQQLKDQLEKLSSQGNAPVLTETSVTSLMDELPGWLTTGPLEPGS